MVRCATFESNGRHRRLPGFMQERVLAFDHQEVEWQFEVLDVRLVGRWLAERPLLESVFVMGGVAQRCAIQARELRGELPAVYDEVRSV